MRTLLLTGAVAGLVVGLAPAASAKIAVDHVVVTGPELSGPIRLGMEEAWTFLVGGGSGTETPPAAYTPRGDLGPRYSVAVAMQPGRDRTLSLYPFAPAGPVLRFGHGKELRWMIEWGERPEHTGWVHVSAVQLSVLHDHGFPEAPPAPAPSPTAEPTIVAVAAAAAPVEHRGPPVAGVLAVSAIALGCAIFVRRAFRRTPKPAD